MVDPQKGKSDMAAHPKRPGLKVGSRTEFLVIGDVIPGHEEVLRQIPKEHMANPRTQEAVARHLARSAVCAHGRWQAAHVLQQL
jgi:hypothetical protein